MPGSRSPDLRRIRTTCTYSVPEIAALLEVHVNTVRRWIRDGLKAMDDHKPTIIRGIELRRFLSNRAIRRKRKCRADQMYCLRCKEPRKPEYGSVVIAMRNQKTVQLRGECCECGGQIWRAGSVLRLNEYTATFGQLQRETSRLMGNSIPLLDSDLKENIGNDQIQLRK